jgi:hypothetical protein
MARLMRGGYCTAGLDHFMASILYLELTVLSTALCSMLPKAAFSTSAVKFAHYCVIPFTNAKYCVISSKLVWLQT